MQLNPRQNEAVTTTGIQLILVGPGSGKTRVITEMVVHLLESGINPAILALTYSDKAAQEMVDRIAEKTTGADVAVRTFHSFCLSVLRELNVDRNPLVRTVEVESGSDNELVAGKIQNPLETQRHAATPPAIHPPNRRRAGAPHSRRTAGRAG